jgi:hypothetical protein
MRYTDEAPKIPAAALGPKSADHLHDELKRGAPVRVKWTMVTRMLPEASSSNVLGEVTGTANPDEVIVVGAHLDSWDLGPGAQDDGAGVRRCIGSCKRRRAARCARSSSRTRRTACAARRRTATRT